MIKHKTLNIKTEGNKQWYNGYLDEVEGLRFLGKEETLEEYLLKTFPHMWEKIDPSNELKGAANNER